MHQQFLIETYDDVYRQGVAQERILVAQQSTSILSLHAEVEQAGAGYTDVDTESANSTLDSI
jgi:hypothetical protein